MEIHLNSTNATDYFLRANKVAWKAYSVPAKARIISALVMALILISSKNSFHFFLENMNYAVIGAGITFVVVAGYSVLSLLRYRAAFFNSVHGLSRKFGPSNSFSVKLSEASFDYKDESHASTDNWGSYTHYSETKDYIFIHAATQFPIEKSALQEADLQELRGFLRNRLPVKRGLFM